MFWSYRLSVPTCLYILCVGVGGCRCSDQGCRASDYQWHKDCVWVDQTDGYTASGLEAGNTNFAAHVALWGARIKGFNHKMLNPKGSFVWFLSVVVFASHAICLFCRSWSCWVPEWWRAVEFLICWLSSLKLCNPVFKQLKNTKTFRHQSEFLMSLHVFWKCWTRFYQRLNTLFEHLLIIKTWFTDGLHQCCCSLTFMRRWQSLQSEENKWTRYVTIL